MEYFLDQQLSVGIGAETKVNIDKVRYEWGGCIYAGWTISSFEIVLSGLIWHFRGFAEERKDEKEKETGEANNYKSLVDQIQALDPNFQNDPNLKKSLLP